MKRVMTTSAAVMLLATTLGPNSVASAALDSGTQEWQFKVFLDDKEIGSHEYRISSDGAERQVETEASFDVKFLFIKAYSYRHENTERWQNNCLTNLEAETDANGKETSVEGRLTDEGFSVSTGDTATSLPACVMSFAYWNPALLDADRLLNAQTGQYEDVDIVDRGADTVEVNGQPVAADRYDIVLDKGAITVWYSTDDQRWLALDAPAKGKRRIRYEPVRVPEPTVRVTQAELTSENNDG